MFMRMQENFSGCRVLSYCVMSNHFHILLEVPPMPAGGISDEELLKRLSAIQSEACGGGGEGTGGGAGGGTGGACGGNPRAFHLPDARPERVHEDAAAALHAVVQPDAPAQRHLVGGALQERDGGKRHGGADDCGLHRPESGAGRGWWRTRRSIAGAATARRWAAGRRGTGRRRERAWCGPACAIRERVSRRRSGRRFHGSTGVRWVWRWAARAVGPRMEKGVVRPQMNTAEALDAKDNGTVLADLGMAKMLRCRVRYFTDGAVIGSKEFVNEAFAGARDRFTERRKDGARRMKGSGKAAAGVLWSVRDLRVGV